MRICDLHTHSNYSDGTDSPEQLLCRAIEYGISAIAMTDHNTTRGLSHFKRAAEGKGIEAIAGVELSCDWRGHEVHILALFLNECDYEEIENICVEMAQGKDEANRHVIEALLADGYKIESCEEIYARSVHGNVNRVHIAESLIRGGYVSSVSDAFSGILSAERGYYHPPHRPDAIEAIARIGRLGAVSVIAHPYLNLTDSQLCEFLEEGCTASLDGMETYYPEYDADTHALARRRAQEYGLIESGGSDYHGERKKNRRLSSQDGFYTPYECYLNLLDRYNKKKVL